jgi:hypothetical protein
MYGELKILKLFVEANISFSDKSPHIYILLTKEKFWIFLDMMHIAKLHYVVGLKDKVNMRS